MYEVWWELGRTRKVVARFRLLKDAQKFIADQDGEGELSIEAAGEGSAPVSVRNPSIGAPRSAPPRSSIPPASAPGRRISGIHGRVQGAVGHPDEFIADQVDDEKADKAACGSAD